MGRGRKDRTKGAFPRYGKGRAGIALALGRAGSRWCWGTFPTGLEQSSAEDSWPKAGSGALRSSPLLPAHGPSQNEGPAGCGVAAGWGSGRMGLAQGAENTAMGRHSHGNMDQLCFALFPMSLCEPAPGTSRRDQSGSPRPAPLCPSWAVSVPTRDGGIRGKLWGFWLKILRITPSMAHEERGIFSRRSGLAAFPPQGQRGSSCSCSWAELGHRLAKSTDRPVLRGRTLFL